MKENYPEVTCKPIGSENIQPSESKTPESETTGSETVIPQPSETEAAGTETPTPNSPKTQTITVKSDIEKTYSTKSFSLDAKTDGGRTLTYRSSNEKVAAVNAAGKVTMKGYGKITITITAAAAGSYLKAEKKITLTVLPKAPSISQMHR